MKSVPKQNKAKNPSITDLDQEPEYLVVGKILSPWGLRGEMKVEVMTDFPDRFAPQREIFVKGKAFVIEASRRHKNFRLIKLAAIDDRQGAEQLRGQLIEISRADAADLEEDQFYYFQIVGLEVFTMNGDYLGKIVDIVYTGSNDVWVVRGDRGEVLIPAIEDVVKSVDLPQRRAVVEEIEGLLKK